MKKFIILLVTILSITILSSCEQRQADKVSYNLSLEADNFNIVRELIVVNTVTDTVLFRMIGKLSIYVDNTDKQLEVTVEDENGQYQKHFIGMPPTVTYTCEQKRFKDVENYKYTFNYNPKMWLPISVETID